MPRVSHMLYVTSKSIWYVSVWSGPPWPIVNELVATGVNIDVGDSIRTWLFGRNPEAKNLKKSTEARQAKTPADKLLYIVIGISGSGAINSRPWCFSIAHWESSLKSYGVGWDVVGEKAP